MRGTYTRFIVGLLALVMVLALAVCGKAAAAKDAPTAAPQSTEAAAPRPRAAIPPASSSGGTCWRARRGIYITAIGCPMATTGKGSIP